MDWMRENMKTIGIVAGLAMLLPFLLTLFGIIRF